MQKFKDLEYKRPDKAALVKEFKGYLKRFKEAKSFDEANEAMLAWEKVTDKVTTQAVIASIRNTMNMKDEFYDHDPISGGHDRRRPDSL